MDVWIWVALAGAAMVVVAGVWWKRRARRVYVINHVRVEMHPPCVIEDRAIEQVWRAAISMTNVSRRPRDLPVLAARAIARTGRYQYLGDVYLDAAAVETSPGEVALVWVEFVLPCGRAPGVINAQLLYGDRAPRSVRLAAASGGVATTEQRPLRVPQGIPASKPG